MILTKKIIIKKNFQFFWPDICINVTELLYLTSPVLLSRQFLTPYSVIQKHRDPIFISIHLLSGVYMRTKLKPAEQQFLVPPPLPFWAGRQITFSSHFSCPTPLFHNSCNTVANSVPNCSDLNQSSLLVCTVALKILFLSRPACSTASLFLGPYLHMIAFTLLTTDVSPPQLPSGTEYGNKPAHKCEVSSSRGKAQLETKQTLKSSSILFFLAYKWPASGYSEKLFISVNDPPPAVYMLRTCNSGQHALPQSCQRFTTEVSSYPT